MRNAIVHPKITLKFNYAGYRKEHYIGTILYMAIVSM
jgi:hypothetical protein